MMNAQMKSSKPYTNGSNTESSALQETPTKGCRAMVKQASLISLLASTTLIFGCGGGGGGGGGGDKVGGSGTTFATIDAAFAALWVVVFLDVTFTGAVAFGRAAFADSAFASSPSASSTSAGSSLNCAVSTRGVAAIVADAVIADASSHYITACSIEAAPSFTAMTSSWLVACIAIDTG